MHFAFLGRLQERPLGAETGDAGRLDKDRFARTAGAVYDALQLMAVVDSHGQDVVIAADGGVGVPQNSAELGIAEKPFDLVLHPFIHFRQLLPDLRELAAGHIQDIPPTVDAAVDALGYHPQIFHRCQEG